MNSKKVVLITGASSGMGKDAALQLIQEGHIVRWLSDRMFDSVIMSQVK